MAVDSQPLTNKTAPCVSRLHKTGGRWKMAALMKNLFALLLILTSGCAKVSPAKVVRSANAEQDFSQISEEFLKGYLAWRPQTGTSLGFHEYDGKVTDFSRDSLNAELARLKRF